MAHTRADGQPRLMEYVRTPVAGACAMFVMEVARSWCGSCSPWNVGLEGLVAGLAGAAAGLFLTIMHPRLARLGIAGEYVLGVLTAWVALVTLDYFWPFVWDSFFGGPSRNYLALLGPAALYGMVVTLDLRFRDWRRKMRVPGRREEEEKESWRARYGMPTQLLTAFTILALCAVTIRAFNLVVYPDFTDEELVSEWEAWVEMHPSDPEAHRGLAMALLRVQRWDEAAAEATRAVELDPQVAAYHETIGWAQLGLGQDRDALDHFWTAARLDPSDARLWRDLARLAHMVREWDQAREAYQHMSTISPNRLFWEEEDRKRWAELFDGG